MWSAREEKERSGGKDLQKKRFQAWNKTVKGRGGGLLIVISMTASSITTV